ncbi:MAG: DUF7305 domain-containing protein [Planctomycetota bacterium]|jgi:hypothetical protein
MSIKRLLQSRKRGSVIALVLVAIVLLLVMGVGLLSLGQHSRIFAVQTTSGIAARCAADAGLTKAVFEMNRQLQTGPWDDNTLLNATGQSLPNFRGAFSYEITGDRNSGYSIQSTGNSGSAYKTVSSELELKGLFEFAIFTRGAMVLKNGTTVSGFNFDADDDVLKVGTNSTAAVSVEMKSGVTIDGDVAVGVGGDPGVVINSMTEAMITGTAYALKEEPELPVITVPNSLLLLPSQGTITTSTTITTSAKYDGISLSSGNIITIDGPVSLYVIGNIILDNSAEVRIVDPNTNPNASLTLYVGGNIEMKNGGTINNLAKDPTRLKIYALDSSRNIDFKNSSDFYGAIYAPTADIHVYNSVQLFGALVGNTFNQDVNADFNYDAALRDVTVDDEGVLFIIKKWSE